MNNFYFTDASIGQGLPVLTKNGAIAKQRLIEYISRLLLERGYIPVSTPHIGTISLFSSSGHYPYYKDSMFPEIRDAQVDSSLESSYVLKPMNCPFHIKAYENLGILSYKDLPIKFYEFAQVYRYEDSGALNGLFRVRTFTQDDGHLFCSMNQIEGVVNECIELIQLICRKFGLKLSVKFSKRPDDNFGDKYVGLKENWNVSQDILKSLCSKNFGTNFSIDNEGAAFYGPKIDFVAKDAIDREWQLGTIQLDFNLAKRFNIKFVTANNTSEHPVLIHRALLGSIERFIGILLENDSVHPYLQPFNMGVIWIGQDEGYLNVNVIEILKRYEFYPTIIKTPSNLREAMSHLYRKGITNIVIVGKKEEANGFINFNKEDIIPPIFEYRIIKLLCREYQRPLGHVILPY